jgi:hypothetical protein
MNYPNGEVYNGQWVDDKREGAGKFNIKFKGIINYKDGTKYEGEWKNDQKKEPEVQKVPDENYQGDLKDGKKSGKGISCL